VPTEPSNITASESTDLVEGERAKEITSLTTEIIEENMPIVMTKVLSETTLLEQEI
jgi:hypothetical protein